MSKSYAARSTYIDDEDDTDIKFSTRPLSAAATRAVAAARARAASLQHNPPSRQRRLQKEYGPSESPPRSPPSSSDQCSLTVEGSVVSKFSLLSGTSSGDSNGSAGKDLVSPSISNPSKLEIHLSNDTELPLAIADEEEETISNDSVHSTGSDQDRLLISSPNTPESGTSDESISQLLSKGTESNVDKSRPSSNEGNKTERPIMLSKSAKVLSNDKPESPPLSPPQSPGKLATVSGEFTPVQLPNFYEEVVKSTQASGSITTDEIATKINDAEAFPKSAKVFDYTSDSAEENEILNSTCDTDSSSEVSTPERAREMGDAADDLDTVDEFTSVLRVDSSLGAAEAMENLEASAEIAHTDSSLVDATAEKPPKREERDTAANESNPDYKKVEQLLDPTAIDSSDESEGKLDLLDEDRPADKRRRSYVSYESDDPAVADVGAGQAAQLLHDADTGEGDSALSRRGSDSDSSSEYLPVMYTPPRANKKDINKMGAEPRDKTKKETSDQIPTSPAVTEATLQSEDDATVVSAKTISSASTLPRANGFNSIALARVEAIDNREAGIGKGDCILSILSLPRVKKGAKNLATSSKKKSEESNDETDAEIVQWAQKSVKDATWRMRHLQFDLEGRGPRPSTGNSNEISSTTKKTMARNESHASKPFDVDKLNVSGSAQLSRTLQDRAVEFMKRNELNEALEMYEEILSSYQAILAKQRRAEGRKHPCKEPELEYHPCIGTALFNIGVVHMLNASYEKALQNFQKSTKIRRECLGGGSMDYFASLVKQGTSHYALGQFSAAKMAFEEALRSGRRETPSERAQIAEILNSLGCVQYESGLRETSLRTFQESLDINVSALSESLYGGTQASSKLIMTKVATTRCNIGLIRLKMKEYDAAICEFEAALMHQLLLFKPSDPVVLATMDKLAFSNVKGGDFNKALKMYNRMLEAQIEALGPHHIDCAQTLTKISLVHLEVRNYDHALNSIDKVMEAESKNGNRNLSGRFKKLSNVGSQTKKKMSAAMAEARKSSRRMGERQKSAKG